MFVSKALVWILQASGTKIAAESPRAESSSTASCLGSSGRPAPWGCGGSKGEPGRQHANTAQVPTQGPLSRHLVSSFPADCLVSSFPADYLVMQIKGYPTMLLFNEGRMYVYTGSRSVIALCDLVVNVETAETPRN